VKAALQMALAGIFFLAALPPFAAASSPSWTPITGNQYNMVAYGMVYLNGLPIQQEGFYVGSFGPGGMADCRSVGPVDTVGNYFATIRGSVNGETIHFLLYNGNSDMTYDVTETLTFQSDALFAGWDLHAIYPTSITVTAPNGGENWAVGASYDITWSSTGTIAGVNIDYSSDSGANWTPVAGATANDGTYSWTIAHTPSTTCLVRVSDTDGDPSDSSDAVFTLSDSTGGSNVFLGHNAGYNETGSNKLYIDSSNTAAPLLYGDFDADKAGINGWLGVGTQAPAYPIELKTTGRNAAIVANRSDGAMNFVNATTTYGQFGTVNNFAVRILANATWKMTLNTDNSLAMASGASCTAGGVWTNASSFALKENITTLSGEEAAATLQALNPVKYNYKADKREEYVGFIAEEVPELVAMMDRKSLSPLDIEAVLTRVLKDQQALTRKQQQTIENMIRRIREQKKVIADLLERVARIEKKK
jgi:hypothetical protein